MSSNKPAVRKCCFLFRETCEISFHISFFSKNCLRRCTKKINRKMMADSVLKTHSHQNRRFILDFGLNRLAIREGEEKFLENQTGFRCAACGVPRRDSKFLQIFFSGGEINQKSWTPSKWRTFKEIKKRKPMTLHGRVLEDSKIRKLFIHARNANKETKRFNFMC